MRKVKNPDNRPDWCPKDSQPLTCRGCEYLDMNAYGRFYCKKEEENGDG